MTPSPAPVLRSEQVAELTAALGKTKEGSSATKLHVISPPRSESDMLVILLAQVKCEVDYPHLF